MSSEREPPNSRLHRARTAALLSYETLISWRAFARTAGSSGDTMGDLPRDVAVVWCRSAGRWFVLFATLSFVGFVAAVLLPPRDTLFTIIARFVALLLAYGGAGFGWVTGSLAGALFLYSRQRPHE